MITDSILSKELIEIQSTLRPQNLFNIQNRSEYCGQQSEYELECKIWDSVTNRKIKTKIQIISTKENLIKYTLDGQILRIDQGGDLPLRNQVWNNFEQIKYLAWFGEIGKSKQKSSKWIAIWKGEVLSNVGGYSKLLKSQYTSRIIQSKVYGINQLIIIGVKLKYNWDDNLTQFVSYSDFEPQISKKIIVNEYGFSQIFVYIIFQKQKLSCNELKNAQYNLQ